MTSSFALIILVQLKNRGSKMMVEGWSKCAMFPSNCSVMLIAFTFRNVTHHVFIQFSSPTESTSLNVDLDYGMKNTYVPASGADGGQGQFGAQSPNNWRVPGTSPVGEASYSGASDGGEEPWFSEAVSTVSLDLEKADETLKAFTKDAAAFKIEQFAAAEPYQFTTTEAAMEELVGKLGYSKFLECSTKQLMKTWKTLHPEE